MAGPQTWTGHLGSVVPWGQRQATQQQRKYMALSTERCNSFLSVAAVSRGTPLRAGVTQPNLGFISASRDTLHTWSPRQLCEVVQGKCMKGIVLQSPVFWGELGDANGAAEPAGAVGIRKWRWTIAHSHNNGTQGCQLESRAW